jgi:glycosyltransferase involved in cell wall biosynthesis
MTTASNAARFDPVVSVIIPAYNEEKFIGATLENVEEAVREYRQTYPYPVEVIVVNNNSTDRTEEIARAHGARVVFEGKNQIAASRNAGGRAAIGQIIAFLDADDHISSNLLTIVHEMMTSGEYIGGGVAKIYRDDAHPLAVALESYNNLARRILGLSTGLIYTTRETFTRLGGFDETYYAAEEGHFVLSMKRLGKKEGKKFGNIRDGYVTKSGRKFKELSSPALVLTWLKFMVFPWKLRDRKACSFWYDIEDRK